MERSKAIEAVKAVIRDMMCATEEEMRDEDVILSDIGIDSLDIVELIMELEQNYDIEIPDSAFDGKQDITLGQIADILVEHS